MGTLQEEFEKTKTDQKLLRWYVIEMNETGYWMFEKLEADMRAALGKFEDEFIPSVFARYVASPDVGVHICSFERMAEAHFIESSPVWEVDVPDDVREFVHEWILRYDESEPVSYFNHSRLFQGIEGISGKGYQFIGATPAKDDGHLEGLLEYERCNPSM